MASQARYDTIGAGYAATRREDPRIAAVIHEALGECASVLNVGAGTGSYEPQDRRVVAVDPSVEMLRQRARDAGPAVRGAAEHLPFPDGSFDAAMAVLTIHHWADLEAGLAECRRVARDRVVLFTWDDEGPSGFPPWVAEYFPGVARRALSFSRALERVARVLGPLDVRPVPIPRDCTDLFGAALWGRPEALLDPAIRGATSAFALADPAEIDRGVERLASDLAGGRWDERYGHLRTLDALDLGFCVVVARRGSGER